MINPDTIGGAVKYLNTPENENYFLSKGYKLPKMAPDHRFDTYKWIYVSYGWIRGIEEDGVFDKFPEGSLQQFLPNETPIAREG